MPIVCYEKVPHEVKLSKPFSIAAREIVSFNEFKSSFFIPRLLLQKISTGV